MGPSACGLGPGAPPGGSPLKKQGKRCHTREILLRGPKGVGAFVPSTAAALVGVERAT